MKQEFKGMNSPPPLCTEEVTKQFRQGDVPVDALRGVSLTVERGDFVAVMGASGSGKSTLLHVMAGLTRPTSGRILVNGHDLGGMHDRELTHFRRQQIGLVFQAFNLIPELTAEENVLLPLFAKSSYGSVNDKLAELLTRLGVADRRRHRPDALSGGEQQRVAIARALITDPAIILADEPTGSLDSATGKNLCRQLQELCLEQKRTIVVVTHEPAVAVWAKRVVVLKDGRLLTEFSTADYPDAHSLVAHYHDIVHAEVAAEVKG